MNGLSSLLSCSGITSQIAGTFALLKLVEFLSYSASRIVQISSNPWTSTATLTQHKQPFLRWVVPTPSCSLNHYLTSIKGGFFVYSFILLSFSPWARESGKEWLTVSGFQIKVLSRKHGAKGREKNSRLSKRVFTRIIPFLFASTSSPPPESFNFPLTFLKEH